MDWTPRDEAELVAGWQLWLALSDQVWPTADWTGTPAEIIQRVRAQLARCDEVERGLLATQPERRSTLTPLIQSLFMSTGAAIELWADDELPLDADRAALLHADLAGVAELVEQVLDALARGGGWSQLDAARHH
ncbi:hypothetical protein [Amycolatopsis suaedae]|uniref:Uncharacterized protein n=1 Tax=Amycolatopsis suaedae TaxID=2510978 RepID=A0A4Q7JDA8_9PSEU|nr:hypothetical protein [Amycolatopsis suaedae]RZQ64354.1 hypothetical protein EWH70_10315 [Amycolatopsis suaedae]